MGPSRDRLQRFLPAASEPTFASSGRAVPTELGPSRDGFENLRPDGTQAFAIGLPLGDRILARSETVTDQDPGSVTPART